MKRAFLLLCMMTIVFAGCKKEEPPPPPPEKPPPPTADELYREMGNALQAVYRARSPEAFITITDAAQAVQSFPPLVQKCRVPENEEAGTEALERMRRDFDEMLKDASQYQKWRFIRCVLDLYKVLTNNNLGKHELLDKRTDLMLQRPRVRSTGFAKLDGELIAFVRVVEQPSEITSEYQVREGEEFHLDSNGDPILRLVRVIGNKEKLEVEYIPVAETWEVWGAGERLNK